MFKDRRHAGRLLADRLLCFADEQPIIYALLRGGLPVADEVARRLASPLDIILVRKIGAPGQEELAIGAIVDGAAPTTILHEDIIEEIGVPRSYIDGAKASALREIERRRKLYLKERPAASPRGRTVIIVDDGLATGATMEAAATAMRKAGAARIIIAIPVAPRDAIGDLARFADEVIALEQPFPFFSVGGQYQSFPQLTDEDVIEILARHHEAETS